MIRLLRSGWSRSLAVLLGLSALFTFVVACSVAEPIPEDGTGDAWAVVYEVLQHPRCLNCHPAGDRPLVGEDSLPHPQNVQRGPDGMGLYAMRCSACHQSENTAGAHMPPGAPHWQLPRADVPLVFEGRSSGELCRQLRDPEHNGSRSPEDLLEHMAEDRLVQWGWYPGEGREPVSVSYPEFVSAVRGWVAGGCNCPE